MVGVDHNIDPVRLQLLLPYLIISRRNYHKRCISVRLPEPIRKVKDLIRLRRARMDHNAVRPCFHIGVRARQRILHALIQDQALDPGDQHKSA